MTQLQLVTDLFDIINNLLEAGLTSCNIHQAREHIDDLFNTFEESQGVLEEIAYFDKQQKAEMTEITMINDCLHHIEMTEAQFPKELKQYFHLIENLEDGYILWLNESESVGDFDVL